MVAATAEIEREASTAFREPEFPELRACITLKHAHAHHSKTTSEPSAASHTHLEATATAGRIPHTRVWWWLWVSLLF